MSIIERAEKNGLGIRCKNGIVRADDHDRFGEIACYFISRNPEGFTVEVQTDATYYCLGDEASFPVRKVVSTHTARRHHRRKDALCKRIPSAFRVGCMTPDEFKAIRLALCLTQTEFGEMLGIGKRQVIHIEQGTRGCSRTISLLVDAILKGYRPVS